MLGLSRNLKEKTPFLDRSLISWHVSYRAWKMQATDFKHIKIGQSVEELWHFEDKRSKLEWGNQTFLSSFLSWQFQLTFAKPYGQGLLHQWPGHSPNLNLIENCSRPVQILISFHAHFILFHFFPFHSITIPPHIPILTTCLWSDIASKRIDRFWCSWCQSLAFSKLYMIHIKKIKNRIRISRVMRF